MFQVPLLPGYKPPDELTKTYFPKLQTLKWHDGIPIPTVRASSATTKHLNPNNLRHQENLLQFHNAPPKGKSKRFIPKWVTLDKKVLQFTGYFTQKADEESGLIHRVRPVIIRYYLLDDTISVHETKTQNSGFHQGLFLKRQKIPKPNEECHPTFEIHLGNHDIKSFWHWSELNRGIVVNFYGTKYTICDCDNFTREFLLSEGTELNPSKEVPIDPYEALRFARRETPNRTSNLRSRSAICYNTLSHEDILRFNVMVDETTEKDKPHVTSAILYYRIPDGKIEIRRPFNYEDQEIKRFSPAILKWIKVPIQSQAKSVQDFGDEDDRYGSFITPKYLVPPTQIEVFGRRVLVTGCDDRAVNFIKDMYGTEISPTMKPVDQPQNTAFGSSGRTQSDISKRKLVKPGAVQEKDSRPIPGGFGGRVLSRTTVPKTGDSSGSSVDQYTLHDIDIGAEIDCWGRRYIINNSDKYSYKFAEEHPDMVSPTMLQSLRNIFSDGQSQLPEQKDISQTESHFNDSQTHKPPSPGPVIIADEMKQLN